MILKIMFFLLLQLQLTAELSLFHSVENGAASKVGHLIIPQSARFLINDGQHRKAAIEEALKKMPELGSEHISVVFFVDGGLKRSQQMFSDLNKHALRPTMSLAILYNHRETYGTFMQENCIPSSSFYR